MYFILECEKLERFPIFIPVLRNAEHLYGVLWFQFIFNVGHLSCVPQLVFGALSAAGFDI